jgi:hypothetical protein
VCVCVVIEMELFQYPKKSVDWSYFIGSMWLTERREMIVMAEIWSYFVSGFLGSAEDIAGEHASKRNEGNQ